MISVVVNGEAQTIESGSNLLDLLTRLDREPRLVAIEHNGAIVPRTAFADTAVAEGDRLEIVQFVQGG